jgi:hypothetical protein
VEVDWRAAKPVVVRVRECTDVLADAHATNLTDLVELSRLLLALLLRLLLELRVSLACSRISRMRSSRFEEELAQPK